LLDKTGKRVNTTDTFSNFSKGGIVMDDISVWAKRLFVAVGVLLGAFVAVSSGNNWGAFFHRDTQEEKLERGYEDLYRQVNDPTKPSVFLKDGEFKDLRDQFPSVEIT